MGDFKCISRFDSVTSPDDIGIFGNDTEVTHVSFVLVVGRPFHVLSPRPIAQGHI